MIWTIDDLTAHCAQTAVKIGRVWVPARPARASLMSRIRAAIAVLRGQADAVIWPAGQ